jgi:hypothetical protein
MMLFDDRALEVHQQWPAGTVYRKLIDDAPDRAEIAAEKKRERSAARQALVAACAIEHGITQMQARKLIKRVRAPARRVADAKTMAEASARVRNDRMGAT